MDRINTNQIPSNMRHHCIVEDLKHAEESKLSQIYHVFLSNAGNPDMDQNQNEPMPETLCGTVYCATLADAQKVCQMYIAEYDLGGGNWTGGQIHQDGEEISHISYNGRIWDRRTHQEIIINN